MIAGLLLAMVLLACAERVAPPDLRVERSPIDDWERLVARATLEGGVDWALLHQERETLDRVLAWYASRGPETQRVPEAREEERLSALLNARNALVVDAVLRTVWAPGANIALLHAPGEALLREREHRVDNEWISIDRLTRHRIIPVFQEPDVLGALYDGTASGPRLRVYRPEYVRMLLVAGMRDWLGRDGGLRPEGEGFAVDARLARHARAFRDWDGAPNLCFGLVDHVEGAARRWMLDHLEDCPLVVFEPDRGLDGAARAQAIR